MQHAFKIILISKLWKPNISAGLIKPNNLPISSFLKKLIAYPIHVCSHDCLTSYIRAILLIWLGNNIFKTLKMCIYAAYTI